jgi:undecaprenyl-diphosphatase
LALPAVFGAGLYELSQALSEPAQPGSFSLAATALATLTAFFVGYAMIAWLLKYVATRSFTPFVIYRVLLGISVLALLWTGIFSS